MAANDISARASLDVSQFKASAQLAVQQSKAMATELAALVSQFGAADKSSAALGKQNEVLAKSLQQAKSNAALYQSELSQQRAVLDSLGKAVQTATREYGENSEQVKKAEIAYTRQATEVAKLEQKYNSAQGDVGKFTAQIAENEKAISDAERGYDEAGEELDEFGDAVEKADKKSSGFSGALKGLAAGVGAVAVAAGAAAAKLGKEVLSAYADYEQLVGGVDTLFKESSETLQRYASNAYKTAGLSANEYMETVTSFSASLIQSLGGDTEKAVSYADMAITDMSDNANKMGTDIASIQNAYQGFAKQNYTMLDNLKLGYGGTKEEMQRLLDDAQKISGIEYDISSYADIVAAIHEVQKGLGLAGATAEEAENTITGSVNSLSAAFDNLVVGLGRADADMGALSKNLVTAFKNVVKNVTPIINNLVAALPEAIAGMLPAIAELLPTLLDAAADLFDQVLSMLVSLLPQLYAVAQDALMAIVDTIIANLPAILGAAVQIISSLASGIGKALPELIPAAIAAVLQVVDELLNNIDMLIDAALQLMMGLADGLINAIPVIIDKIPTIIISLINALVENLPKLVQAGYELIGSLAMGLIKAIPEIWKAIPQILMALVQGIGRYIVNMMDVGKNLVSGLWEGIKNAGSWLMDKIKEWCGSVINGIKGFFGIHSPSTLFRDEIGKNLGYGVGEGFEAAMPGVIKDMKKSLEGVTNGMTAVIPLAQAAAYDSYSALPASASANTGAATNISPNIVININAGGADNSDENWGEISDTIAEKISNALEQLAQKKLRAVGAT